MEEDKKQAGNTLNEFCMIMSTIKIRLMGWVIEVVFYGGDKKIISKEAKLEWKSLSIEEDLLEGSRGELVGYGQQQL